MLLLLSFIFRNGDVTLVQDSATQTRKRLSYKTGELYGAVKRFDSLLVFLHLLEVNGQCSGNEHFLSYSEISSFSLLLLLQHLCGFFPRTTFAIINFPFLLFIFTTTHPMFIEDMFVHFLLGACICLCVFFMKGDKRVLISQIIK